MAIEVYPVVHINTVDQAVKQAALAYEHAADGVYLIDHHTISDTDTLMTAYNAVRADFPQKFIGLNFLQHSSAAYSLRFLYNQYDSQVISAVPNGLWTDDAYADREATRAIRELFPGLSYLGGIAFKSTATATNDPRKAVCEAERLKNYVDVVTTSGMGTGSPPPPAKINAMKRAIGNQKLAVASGISAENIETYGGRFDQLLVSSSIETHKYSGEFVPGKLADLIELAHSIETS